MIQKPEIRPASPYFSSGPCSKRPGWTPEVLKQAATGRSHRSAAGKDKLKQVIDRSREVLGIPDDYVIGIVPGSDTGAMEMAMWSLLGPKGVDVLAWENFGKDWVIDVTTELPLDDIRVFEADYGLLPDFSQTEKDRDVIFTWNGTTAGVCLPNADWVAEDRTGLTICDATSAAFAMDLPWEKLDVVTYSWQKILGGEAAHGMLILSPNAVKRLETHKPAWPIPKLFRLTKKGKLNEGIFKGATINTPSLLCAEDCLDALDYVDQLGGCQAVQDQGKKSLQLIADWVAKTDWIEFLAQNDEERSWTGICLKISTPEFDLLSEEEQRAIAGQIVKSLEAEGVGYDFGAYRTAPPGLRIWAGATVRPDDIAALLPWLDWAWAQIQLKKAA